MNDLDIRGIQKVSMIDFPGKIASTVFLNRCNFRCPFCHNPELVFDTDKNEPINPDEFLDFMREKKKWLDGVCITGGEPTLHKGLKVFIKKIKDLGFAVKLDTNGTNPEILQDLYENNILDYVAMDIKTHLDDYDKITKVKVDKEKIQKSIDLIRNSGKEYEFRTTVVPTYHKKEDMTKIGEWLKGSMHYTIQQFRNNTAMVDMELRNTNPYSLDTLIMFRDELEPYFDKCEVRGL